jgi:hypothetical protein
LRIRDEIAQGVAGAFDEVIGPLTPDAIALSDRLAQLGHVTPLAPLSPGTAQAPIIGPRTWGELLAAAKALIEYYGEQVSPATLRQAQRLLDQPRCNVPDRLAAGGQCQWDHSPVRVHHRIALPGMSADDVSWAWSRAWQVITAACGLEVVADPVTPNVLSEGGPIDRAGRILAWAEMPCPAGESARLRQLYDSGDRWTRELLAKVILHESLHSLGIGHSNDRNSVMFPSILNNDLTLGRWDVEQLVARYGPPRNRPTPETPTTPTQPGRSAIRMTFDGRTVEWDVRVVG